MTMQKTSVTTKQHAEALTHTHSILLVSSICVFDPQRPRNGRGSESSACLRRLTARQRLLPPSRRQQGIPHHGKHKEKHPRVHAHLFATHFATPNVVANFWQRRRGGRHSPAKAGFRHHHKNILYTTPPHTAHGDQTTRQASSHDCKAVLVCISSTCWSTTAHTDLVVQICQIRLHSARTATRLGHVASATHTHNTLPCASDLNTPRLQDHEDALGMLLTCQLLAWKSLLTRCGRDFRGGWLRLSMSAIINTTTRGRQQSQTLNIEQCWALQLFDSKRIANTLLSLCGARGHSPQPTFAARHLEVPKSAAHPRLR
jgi:hypothetical protein